MNLIFDLDGTLSDPKEGIVGCIRHAMEGLGRPVGVEVNLDWCIGPPLKPSLAKLLGDEKLAAKALELYRERFKERGMFENRLYLGIAEALGRLGRRQSLYVATSKPEVFAKEILAYFGIQGSFAGIYGSELDGKNSDKADLIAHLLSREELAPGSAVMIGDREHDVYGAKKNGLMAFGVAWGYGSPEELMQAGAKEVFRDPSEMADYFDKGIS